MGTTLLLRTINQVPHDHSSTITKLTFSIESPEPFENGVPGYRFRALVRLNSAEVDGTYVYGIDEMHTIGLALLKVQHHCEMLSRFASLTFDNGTPLEAVSESLSIHEKTFKSMETGFAGLMANFLKN